MDVINPHYPDIMLTDVLDIVSGYLVEVVDDGKESYTKIGGEYHGEYRSYHPNGQSMVTCSYEHGEYRGQYIEQMSHGVMIEWRNYD
jgi:hypothetical protein